MKHFFPFSLLLLTQLASAQSNTVASLIAGARALDSAAHEEEALPKYLEVLKLDSSNYEATWNTSFLYSRIGNRLTDMEKKKQYFNLAKQYAQQALRLNPRDAQSNFVMAVAMGRMALISSAKEKVAASRDIKKYAELAIQYNPSHGGAYHLLGKWNYEVANLNWAERTAANMLFGGIPEGSLDEAIRNYLKAIKFEPNIILYYLNLAIALKQKEYYEEEVKVLNHAIAIKPTREDDPGYIEQCRKLLEERQ